MAGNGPQERFLSDGQQSAGLGSGDGGGAVDIGQKCDFAERVAFGRGSHVLARHCDVEFTRHNCVELVACFSLLNDDGLGRHLHHGGLAGHCFQCHGG